MTHSPLEPTLLAGPGFDAMVAERIAAVASGDESAYIAELGRSPDEVERLAADIAVPETWLFRYPKSYDLLVDILRHQLTEARTLSMCSIGCATGPEPYCMAMAALHAGWMPERVRIDAIDRNPEALAVGAAGVYGPSSIRGEMPGWATEYLDRDADTIRIAARVRAMVQFSRMDVTASPIDGPYDVIFCRNVLIYLNTAARTKLVRDICAALKPGGVLFVGHAEQFLRGEDMLRPIADAHTFALMRTNGAEDSDLPAMGSARTPRADGTRRTVTASGRMPSPQSIVTEQVQPATVTPAVPTIADALALADAGRVQESEALARSIMARCGPTAAAMELMGLIRLAADDVTGAKRFFEQAVYLEPQRAACLLQLALISERSGDSQRAAAYWERARRAASIEEMQQ